MVLYSEVSCRVGEVVWREVLWSAGKVMFLGVPCGQSKVTLSRGRVVFRDVEFYSGNVKSSYVSAW